MPAINEGGYIYVPPPKPPRVKPPVHSPTPATSFPQPAPVAPVSLPPVIPGAEPRAGQALAAGFLNEQLAQQEALRILMQQRQAEEAAAMLASNTRKKKGGRLARNLSGYQLMAARAARKEGVPIPLFLAHINQESGFDPTAVSSAGALGLAQFMPATAEGMGVNPLDPKSALRGGARLLRGHKDNYGTWRDALSAYNSGQPWSVGQGIEETRNHIATVLANAAKPWGGVETRRRGGGGRLAHIYGGRPFSWGGGPEAHGTRYPSNWQSDNAYDLMAPAGTPVHAVARGLISPNAGFGPSNDGGTVYGSRLTLDVPGPNELFYTHMSRIAPGISPGTRVTPGQLLGWIADYGNADHIHFASKLGDPKAWLTGKRAPGPTFAPQGDYGSGMVDTAWGPAPASIVAGVESRVAPLVSGVEDAAQTAYAPAQLAAFANLAGAGGPLASAVKKRKKGKKKSNNAVDELIASLLTMKGGV